MATQRRTDDGFFEDPTPTGVTSIEEVITSVGEKTPWEEHHDPGLTPRPEAADLSRLEDRYELYEEIARGGMASVHLGRSIEPGAPRAVAIKMLHAELAQDPSFVAMFVDEARLAARVHHPNVAAPRDFVLRAAQGELCLVMEYVHGETLSQLVARSIRRDLPMPPTVAVGIMVGVLRGLHAAHEATTDDGTPLQMVHRDVSPQNIMVGTDGLARVLDFGVAKAMAPEASSGQNELAGKPGYLAPEQLRFDEVDRRADIFAAGVVLWELLAGRRLFRHSDPRILSVNILSGQIPPPSNFNPGVPAALDAIVLHALERDRDQRCCDARVFARAIADALTPASVTAVGDWVKKVSGYLLASRAHRIAQIMAAQHTAGSSGKDHLRPVSGIIAGLRRSKRSCQAAGSRPLGVSDLFRRTHRGRRWTILGLVLVALAVVAPSISSRRASHQWTALSTANAASTRSVIPAAPLAPPAAAPVAEPPAAAPPAPAAPQGANTVAAPDEGRDKGRDDDRPAAETGADSAPISEASSAATDAAPSPERAPTAAPHPRSVRSRTAPANNLGAALAGIRALHKRALAAYNRADYESSRRLLRAALGACATARLRSHPIAAATHVYLGVVLVGGFKQPELGIEEFRQALKIDPEMLLSSRHATPTLSAAFQQAVDRS